MTNKEFITKRLKPDISGFDEDDVDIILLENGLNADDVVTDRGVMCKKALHNSLSVILFTMSQNNSLSEGGLSVSKSWNRDFIKDFYNALCNELGLENVLVGRPKVRNRSNYW